MTRKECVQLGDESDRLLFNMDMVISDITRQEAIKRDLDYEKLTFTEKRIIGFLSQIGSSSMGSLSKRVNISSRSICRPVNALEEKGFVERFGIEKDKKIIMVRLTERGKKITDEFCDMSSEITHNNLETCLTEDEQQDMIVLTKRLADLYEKVAKQLYISAAQLDKT